MKFDKKYMKDYEEHFLTLLDSFEKIKQESHRKNGFKLLRLYFEELYKQVLEPEDIKTREMILMSSKFMPKITDVILLNLSDYHDTIREESQLLLVSMTERFLPPQINLMEEQRKLIQVLKANISQGWPNQLNG